MLNRNEITLSVNVLKVYNQLLYGYHNYHKDLQKFSFPIKVILPPEVDCDFELQKEVVVFGLFKQDPATKQGIVLAKGIENGKYRYYKDDL